MATSRVHIISAFFCCFTFRKRENGCLFRAAAWLVFCLSCCKCCFQCSIVVWKTMLMFQTFSMLCPGLFFLDLQLKMILSRPCTLLSNCQHLFEAKVYPDHQLTIYLGKMFYTSFLTSESN